MSTPTETNPFVRCETIHELLVQLAAAASVCCEHSDAAGVFDSDQASEFVTAADARLRELLLVESWAILAKGAPTIAADVTDQALSDYQKRSGGRMVDYEPVEPERTTETGPTPRP